MPVYLDHAATTPMLPAARAALIAALDLVGNPSSIHTHGQSAKRMLEEAREVIAGSLGCDPIEIVLTSGGTESVNLGVKGLFWARDTSVVSRKRILVPRGEHHATIDAAEWLVAHEGAVIEWLPIDELGRIPIDSVAQSLREHDDIALLTMLWANNEVGTVQPVAEIVALAAERGVPVHVDAVAAYGHLPVSLRESGAAAISVSAHKVGGPLGMGALALARTAVVEPLLHGGGQQRNVRSGTQDAPAAVAFAAAVEHPPVSLTHLRDALITGVRSAVPDAVLRGDPHDRLDNNAHFTFPGCAGDSLLFMLDSAGISASTGSACQAGIPEASHVLLGMGLSEAEARGALRFTLGHDSTASDIEALLSVLPDAVARARRAGYSNRAV